MKILIVVVILIGTVVTGSSQTPAAAHAAFMRASFGVTDQELKRVDAGQVVARTVSTRGPKDVTTLGVVRINVPPAFYVAHLDDIVSFKRDDAVLQIGTFGTPPTLSDVQGLTFDESDLSGLRECRVGRCGVQLPAAAIQRLQREVDWRSQDANQRAQTVIREVLVDYVSEFLKKGIHTSMRYADAPVETDPAHEFASMLQSQTVQGPGQAMSQAEPGRTSVYWSKEKVGGRGVVSITQMSIARLPTTMPTEYVIGSKQIYSSHYYDASLGMTILVCDRALPAPAVYVIYVNQSRIDLFEGAFGAIVRNVVKGRARNIVATRLGRLQRTLEEEFQRSHGPSN